MSCGRKSHELETGDCGRGFGETVVDYVRFSVLSDWSNLNRGHFHCEILLDHGSKNLNVWPVYIIVLGFVFGL